MKFISITLLALYSLALDARELVRTDLGRVRSSGQLEAPSAEASLRLSSGVYSVSANDGSRQNLTMIIEESVNDPAKFLALLVPEGTGSRAGVQVGNIFLGRPAPALGGIMLSPLGIDLFGNLSVTSEAQRNAPVVQLTPRGNDFLLQGHNGALGGRLFVMSSRNRGRANLSPTPRSGEFNTRSQQGSIVVTGTVLSLLDGNRDRRFQIIPLNGDLGRFAALVDTQLDTMSESMLSQTSIQRLVAFVSGVWSGEQLFVITPSSSGEFQFAVYLRN
jgi:hypothetical protein